ncbi:hypothetical protein DL765_002791 [Monosporascus sp. GIB2]|nr:hypothetical protein DL765_002791 [Monosporascus sp. GIB2]
MAPTRARKSDATTEVAAAPDAPKRGRGRPPKNGVSAQPKKEPSGRPRGRPPGSGVKKTTAAKAAAPKKAAATGTRSSGRGRGRPPKSDASTTAAVATPNKRAASASGKKSATPKSVASGKRGRPRKSDVSVAAAAATEVDEREEEEPEENGADKEAEDSAGADTYTDEPMGDAPQNGDDVDFARDNDSGDAEENEVPSYVPDLFSTAYKAYRRVSRRFTESQ